MRASALPRPGLFAVILLLLCSCTAHRQYRTDYQPCRQVDPQHDCTGSAFQVALDTEDPRQISYLLGFVEFDDQGQLFDREQLRELETQLIEESGKRNLIMVVFVHGWKHNARAGDDNIRQFRTILAKLAEAENRISPQPRRVVGVYLGWRGKSLDLGPLTNLSFWNRKATAHRVGHGGAIEALARLEGIRHIDQKMDEGEQGRPTRLVIVGHSFGGALVHSALDQVLKERFIDIEAEAQSPREFSDLVVLINPAFEALRHATLAQMAGERTYLPGQRPILAILTSEADLATKVAFPMGRSFSTIWQKERTPQQKAANLKAVGHYAPMQTHHLEWSVWPEGKTPTDVVVGPELIARTLAEAASSWGTKESIAFPGSTLRHLHKNHPLAPYLNIYVDKRIIQGHNDIYDDRLVEFLRHFIILSLDSDNDLPQK